MSDEPDAEPSETGTDSEDDSTEPSEESNVPDGGTGETAGVTPDADDDEDGASDGEDARSEGEPWEMDASDDPGGETLQRRLAERELGLDKRSEALDEREEELAEREEELDEFEEELDELARELEKTEARLERREEELDEREENLDEFEEDLSERATELGEHEETLHRYIDGQVEDLEDSVRETMLSALDSYEGDRGSGRFGPTANLLVGLAGLTLAAAGVGYGGWTVFGAAGGLFAATTSNLAVAAVLLLAGLAVNLVALTDRA